MDSKNMKEISLDELNKVSGGTIIDIGDNTMDNEITIPFECSCGTTFYVKPGNRIVKCPNPSCGKVSYLP